MAQPETDATLPPEIRALRTRIRELESELEVVRSHSPDHASAWDALRLRERRFRALVTASSQSAWNTADNELGREGGAWWENLTGQPAAAASNWGWLEMVHPEDRERARADWEQALRDRRLYSTEYRVRDRAGNWRDLSCRGVPLMDSDGNPTEWVGTFNDVTDHKIALRSLARSEERFRTIFNLAAVGIVQLRLPDGRFTAANRKMEAITGYTAQELLTRTYLDITHPDDRAANLQLFESMIAGSQQSFSYEKRYLTKDGRVVWVTTHNSIVRDPSGTPLHVIGIVEDVTARKQAEEAAARSDAKLKIVTDSVPALISYIDDNYTYQFANRAYEEWFGLSPHDVIGKSVPEVLGDSAFERLKLYMDKALHGEFSEYEDWAPYASGRRFIRAIYVPDIDAGGQVCGLAVLVEDLTEKREAADRIAQLNQELQERVRDFEVLFESIPVAVAVARDPHARDIRLNKAFAELLNFTTSENASKSRPDSNRLPYRFVRNEFEIPFASLPQQRAHNEGRAIENEELEVVRDDGKRFHLYGSAVPLFDDSGAVRGSIAAYVDVTDRKRAEDALKHSEQRLSRLIDASPFGIAIGNIDGAVLYGNDSFLRMTGYTRSELIAGAIRWIDITPPEWLHRDRHAMEELRATGTATPFEKEYIRTDGTRVPILIGACLLDAPYATQQQVVTFYLDLTRRKQAEIELRNANQELLGANSALEQFAYAAAHDLQEPLRMVSLYAQLLERKSEPMLDPSTADLVQEIVDSARRAQALVSDLLAYTLITEVSTRDVAVIDCNRILAVVRQNLSAAINESAAILTSDDLPQVRISDSHLVQLLQNLISNGIKYSRPGVRPEIHVAADRSDRHWIFCVRDNGIGLKPEHQERIFGVFKRLHGKDVPGTGIGLALCKRIVERYGGRIWVESEGPGRGSAFYFSLPANVQ